MTDHLVVSPHADDAVWSSGGRIARWVKAGDRVTVLTVFDGAGTALASPDWLMPVPQRRAEDDEALQLLGARRVGAGLPEAALRMVGGHHLYTNPLRLFGTRATADAGLVEVLRDIIGEHLDPGAVLHAPLGIGGHVDHVIVADAVASLAVPKERQQWYEDFPYRRRGGGNQITGLVASLTEVDLPSWLAAAACYRSQSRLMFGDTARLQAAIEQRAATHGRDAGWSYAERVWS